MLAKLPATAAQLTHPERGQLRELERAGQIRYDGERWVAEELPDGLDN